MGGSSLPRSGAQPPRKLIRTVLSKYAAACGMPNNVVNEARRADLARPNQFSERSIITHETALRTHYSVDLSWCRRRENAA
jgi:hypothetical protein